MGNDKKESGFIKEVVKEKSKKKLFLMKLIPVLIIAAAAAFVAAFVFALTLPLAKNVVGHSDESSVKIDINEDDAGVSPTPAASSTSAASKESSDVEPVEPVVVYPEVSLEDYEKIYDDLKNVAEPVQKAVVKVTGITSQTDYFNQTYENSQQTSGIIIGENENSLFIATDYSILENVERIQVELESGTLVDGVYQSSDKDTGIAVIKIPKENIAEEIGNTIEIAKLGNSYNVTKGDPVIAMGNPMGYPDYISYGMITSASNMISVYDSEYSVFTTSITGGTGGMGVIVNLNSEVVGVIISKQFDISKNTINAYPVSQIKGLLEQLSNNEPRAFLGIKGADVSAQISERTGIPKGMIITEVKEESPAMLAGLTLNDVIVGLNGEEIQTVSAYSKALKKCQPKEKISMTVMRKGAEGYTEVEFELQVGENK